MKKILSYVLGIAMIVSLLWIPSEQYMAAGITVKASKSTINVGEQVTISITVPAGYSADIALDYPQDMVSYVGSSATSRDDGNNVLLTIGEFGNPSSSATTETVTFKAKTSGTASFSGYVTVAGDSEGNSVSLSGDSTTVTIANETEDDEDKSPDNSLSSIKISSGTLSPAFKYNVTRYTATVGYDVSSITVSAKTSNEKATIESITGNGTVALSVGENTIQIVVKAENGTKATYTIVVTRKAQDAEDDEDESESETETESETEDEDVSLADILQWNGEQYEIPGTIPTDMIPEDFTQDSILIKNTDVTCFKFSKADLTVLCLKNSNGANELFVYDKNSQSIYPFVKILSEKSYAMVLLPDEANAPAPAGSQACTLVIEGKGMVYAYQFADSARADFYLVYCMNNNGTLGWYLYDTVEGTIQRYVQGEVVSAPVVDTVVNGPGNTAPTDLQTQYNILAKELSAAKLIQMIAIVVAVILAIILVIVLILLLKKGSDEGLDEELEEEEEFEEDDEELDEKEYNRRGYGDYFIKENKPVIKEPVAEVPVVEEPEIPEEDEIEIEFYEMSQEGEMEIESFDIPEEDEVEIEFYEMTEEVETVEVQPVEVDTLQERKGEDLEDDDIEFLDL